MEKIIEYIPKDVCSRSYKITVDDDIIKSIEIIGGCNGNLQGIAHLVQGMKVEDAISRLENIKCRGSRNGDTSCPDQIAKALKSINN